MSRTTVLLKVAVPAAVLALALSGCHVGADEADTSDSSGGGASSASPTSPDTPASPAGDMATDPSPAAGSGDGWKPGDDPANHVPKGATAGSGEVIPVTFTKGSSSVTFGLKPHDLQTKNGGKPFNHEILYNLRADFSYEKGDAGLMAEAARSLALYADDETPETIALTLGDDPELNACALKTEADFGTRQWSKGTQRTGCEPFLIPLGKKTPQHMGIFGTPPRPGSKIAVVWSF